MKLHTGLFVVLSAALLVMGIQGCSSAPEKGSQPIELSANAPTVLNARAEPSTVQLNSDMQPMTPVQVVADVKDFKSHVTDVRLQFEDIPLEVPMENIGGTTWRAELTPQELQMLAVSGKTIKYKTKIIAKNASGDTAETHEPLLIAVKAPQPANYG